MNKKRILWIIGACILALIGLVSLQIAWVKNAIDLRTSQLNHRIRLASYDVIYKIKQDSSTRKNIVATLQANAGKKLVVQLNEADKNKLQNILENEFRYHQLQGLKYSFEIIDKKYNGYSKSCKSDFKTNTEHAWCLDRLFKPEKVELRLSFLNSDEYVYAKMNGMMFSSAGLVLLVIFCFILTIQTIFKQKKLSDMTTDFINNMTHELKTPISTISLASNMLKKPLILDKRDKIVHFASIISEENQKLQNQVEQVLHLAKLERGDFKLQKIQADIHEVIQRAIDSIDLQVNTRGGKIKCYMNAIQTNLMADVTHLTNVVSNLLDNANKYSPEKPEITITTYNREDGVVLTVEDKGIGMSKDKQKYIFEKFYRVTNGNVHDVKGFGIGLAYVKLMIDAHKGHIQLQSELGKGSRFEVFLPFQ
jgi:two-component system phosphate regulon sensor histidine kinase PhoR